MGQPLKLAHDLPRWSTRVLRVLLTEYWGDEKLPLLRPRLLRYRGHFSVQYKPVDGLQNVHDHEQFLRIRCEWEATGERVDEQKQVDIEAYLGGINNRSAGLYLLLHLLDFHKPWHGSSEGLHLLAYFRADARNDLQRISVLLVILQVQKDASKDNCWCAVEQGFHGVKNDSIYGHIVHFASEYLIRPSHTFTGECLVLGTNRTSSVQFHLHQHHPSSLHHDNQPESRLHSQDISLPKWLSYDHRSW